MAFAVNKCGGRSWKTHGDWRVEVEGEGFPMVTPNDPRFPYMTRTWAHWGPLMQKAAKRYGIPVSWILALASIETGFLSSNPETQRKAVSPAGAAGIMQLMPFVATMYGHSADERSNPEVSIDVGAHLISDLARGRTGPELPHIGSAYNAGAGSSSKGVRCSVGRNEWNMAADHNYPRQAVEFNNAAIHFLNVNQDTATWVWALGGVVSAAVVGYALYSFVPTVREHVRF